MSAEPDLQDVLGSFLTEIEQIPVNAPVVETISGILLLSLTSMKLLFILVIVPVVCVAASKPLQYTAVEDEVDRLRFEALSSHFMRALLIL